MSTDNTTVVETVDAKTTMRVIIHADKCIGAGHCVDAAADVFAQNEDDGVVILLVENPSVNRKAAVMDAARRCPVMAIEIE